MKVIEALESGISFDGPSGKVTIDPKTHHTIRNAYLGSVKDRKLQMVETFRAAAAADTGGVCDLIKNPNDEPAIRDQV